MKKIHILAAIAAALMLTACGGSNSKGYGKDSLSAEGEVDVAALEDGQEVPMREVTIGQKTYNIADIDDRSAIYRQSVDKTNCFIVISKQEYRLYVYEVVGGDTLLAAHFPVCYARNPEAKEGEGDMKTPECGMQNPFFICQMQDASTWEHDFKDGRGSLLSYGAWFHRLKLNGALEANRSIGIHGSTNNEQSVPGRDSEGCIRLRDADLVKFHDLYAALEMKVIIKSIKQAKLPFEKKAEEALGDKYVRPRAGNPVQGASAAPAGDGAGEPGEQMLRDENNY